MRVGKFIEHFRRAAIASDAKSMDPILRWTAIGRQLGYAGYMLLDNATVVSRCPRVWDWTARGWDENEG